MPEPSHKAVGNFKKLVGKVLGDCKLVAEGGRQRRGETAKGFDKRGARLDGPPDIREPT